MERFLQALKDQLSYLFSVNTEKISKGIRELMDYKGHYLSIGDSGIWISDAVISMLIAVLFIIVLTFYLRSGLTDKRPSRKQAVLESFFQSINSMAKNMGLSDKHCETAVPFVIAVFIFVTISNLTAVFKLKPPTQNPSFPIFLAIFDLLMIIGFGIRYVGFKGFFRSLLFPEPILLPFNILDYFIKPISLAFRLFGNIFGAFILIEFITLVVPVIFPSVLGIWFDVGDGIVQGGVFAYLTLNYISEIVERSEAMHEVHLQNLEEKKKKRQQLQALKTK